MTEAKILEIIQSVADNQPQVSDTAKFVKSLYNPLKAHGLTPVIVNGRYLESEGVGVRFIRKGNRYKAEKYYGAPVEDKYGKSNYDRAQQIREARGF